MHSERSTGYKNCCIVFYFVFGINDVLTSKALVDITLLTTQSIRSCEYLDAFFWFGTTYTINKVSIFIELIM